MRSGADGTGKEIEILEDEKKSQVAKQAYPKVEPAAVGLLRFLYLQTGHVVDQGDGPDHEDVAGAPAHVEVVAGYEQNDFSDRAARDHEKQPDDDKK